MWPAGCVGYTLDVVADQALGTTSRPDFEFALHFQELLSLTGGTMLLSELIWRIFNVSICGSTLHDQSLVHLGS